MRVLRFLLAVALITASGCASDATVHASASALAGHYYSGDGLGRNVYVDLHPDGTFFSDWQGCLGLYGEATGHWKVLAEKIVFIPDKEAGSLTGYLQQATIIRHDGKLGFARDQDVEEEKIHESLVFSRGQ